MPARRIAQHFDVAVLGRATGGMVAAALLAKAGMRVVTLAAPPPKPPAWRRPLYVPSQSIAVRRVLERLGLLWARHPSARKPAPRQVLLPNRRLDVPYGQQAALQMLAAEWPACAGALNAWFERLHRLNALCERVTADDARVLLPVGLDHVALPFRLRRARRFAAPIDATSIDALFANIPTHHPLRAVLMTPLYALHARNTFISLFAAVRALHRYWCEEPWTLGDADAPLQALWDAASLRDGQWWPQRAMRVHLASKKRLGDIVAEDTSQVATAQMVLLNAADDEASPLLLDEAGQPVESRGGEAAAAQGASDAPLFGIKGNPATVPVGLLAQANVACADSERMWQWMRPPAPDEGDVPRPYVLFARAVGPHGPAGTAAHLRALLGELAPYFADTCEIKPVGGTQEAPKHLWGSKQQGSGPLGVQARSMKTPYANAFCTHDGVAPALGIEGAFWVGWRAAEEVERRLGRRKTTLKRWQPRFDAAL